MNQGNRTSKLKIGSGLFKVAESGLSIGSAAATMTGAGAPVGAALSAASAAVSVAKFAFEHGYKRRMQKKALAKEYNIDWDQEMIDVETMIHKYNPNYDISDAHKREIILKARGTSKSMKKAYTKVSEKRAAYLINTANQTVDPKAGPEYQNVATLVIQGMGIHKVGRTFAEGAVKLLAKKLEG